MQLESGRVQGKPVTQPHQITPVAPRPGQILRLTRMETHQCRGLLGALYNQVSAGQDIAPSLPGQRPGTQCHPWPGTPGPPRLGKGGRWYQMLGVA